MQSAKLFNLIVSFRHISFTTRISLILLLLEKKFKKTISSIIHSFGNNNDVISNPFFNINFKFSTLHIKCWNSLIKAASWAGVNLKNAKRCTGLEKEISKFVHEKNHVNYLAIGKPFFNKITIWHCINFHKTFLTFKAFRACTIQEMFTNSRFKVFVLTQQFIK